jgi:hypothetical protein
VKQVKAVVAGEPDVRHDGIEVLLEQALPAALEVAASFDRVAERVEQFGEAHERRAIVLDDQHARTLLRGLLLREDIGPPATGTLPAIGLASSSFVPHLCHRSPRAA